MSRLKDQNLCQKDIPIRSSFFPFIDKFTAAFSQKHRFINDNLNTKIRTAFLCYKSSLRNNLTRLITRYSVLLIFIYCNEKWLLLVTFYRNNKSISASKTLLIQSPFFTVSWSFSDTKGVTKKPFKCSYSSHINGVWWGGKPRYSLVYLPITSPLEICVQILGEEHKEPQYHFVLSSIAGGVSYHSLRSFAPTALSFKPLHYNGLTGFQSDTITLESLYHFSILKW